MSDLFSSTARSTVEFETAYNKLNQAQQKAVEHIQGPVMVIAGPGTGKTQILAVRIGNILKKTDTDPRSILCLTFTDAGATAMRNRLQQFIGAAAYDVGIFTFHSFCNMIIRENPEEFDLYGDFDLASDLDLNLIVNEIVQEFTPSHPLYNYKQNYTFTCKRLLDLFNLIKKENWDAKSMIHTYHQELEENRLSDKFIYKRKTGEFIKGDFNEKAFKKYKSSIDKAISAFECFIIYQEKLSKKELFDFQDMITWVYQKFKSDEYFLSKYQERFLYFLVDEYQDTNGIQNEIVYQLAAYDKTSNIFVVGDDDQAIYRFQGAKMNNMIEFKQRFDPEIIVLTENYRSSQNILNGAGIAISNNIERLIHVRSDLSKDLISAGDNKSFTNPINILEYSNVEAEIIGTCNAIQQQIQDGTKPSEIAILFKKNKEANPYIKYLQSIQIPYFVSREVDVLHEPLIQQIILFLNFFQKSQKSTFAQDELLIQILHFPYIEISVLDIGRIARYLSKYEVKKTTLEFLNDLEILTEIQVSNTDLCVQIQEKFIYLIQNYFVLTPQVFLEKLFHDFGILKFVINSPDKYFLLNVLNRFYEYIKNQSSKNQEYTMDKLLVEIQHMLNNNIAMPIYNAIGTKHGVQLSTIYKSKGLEYDSVFIINNTAKNWKSRDTVPFTLPEQILRNDISNDEDERRVFYVGLTRARKHLTVSFSKENLSAKNDEPSKYLSELLMDPEILLSQKQIDDESIAQLLISEMSLLKKDFDVLNDEFLDKFLEDYRLSPTALDKYLRCPVAFYYENVLRVPSARTAPFGFGRAVHESLHQFLYRYRDSDVPNLIKLEELFIQNMLSYKSHFTASEYTGYLEEGKQNLIEFVRHYWPMWRHAESMQFEIKKKEAFFREIPISGQLDRIDFIGNRITVIDYKTGNSSNAKQKVKAPDAKNPDGTDYWRQMIFYSIVLDYYPEFRNKDFSSIFYFVIKNEDTFAEVQVIPTDESKQKVGQQIIDVYTKIRQKKFAPGCGESDCTWCNYLNSGSLLKLHEDVEEIDES